MKYPNLFLSFFEGTLFFNVSIFSHVFVGTPGDPRALFAPKGLEPFFDAAFVPNHNYNHLLTSTVSITSFFNQFTLITRPKLLLVPPFFWNVLQVWMTGKDVSYKWHEVDQTKHEIFCVHIVCNEIQVKVNLEITTFFFYLRFPYCPNFFWFGVVQCFFI